MRQRVKVGKLYRAIRERKYKITAYWEIGDVIIVVKVDYDFDAPDPEDDRGKVTLLLPDGKLTGHLNFIQHEFDENFELVEL